MSVKSVMSDEGSVKTTSMTILFSKTLKSLPVDLKEFVLLSKTNPDILFTEQTLDRLLQIVLAEQDTRISSKATKLQVIEILKTIAGIDREHRCALRLVLQSCKKWFDDDVDPEVRERTSKDGHGELLPERDRELVMKVKLMFALCWRTPPAMLKALVQDDSLRIEQCKITILQNYAATALQALARSKIARLHLHRSLQAQAAEQEEEVKQWSVLIIQKVARGYIARRTVLRSMQIRRTLNKEVLRIAERYLQHGDLWGFLKQINDELTRSQNEIQENLARENDWAANFVEKVIAHRHSQFNAAWDEFPKALREFNGKDDGTGALMTKLGTGSPAGKNTLTSLMKSDSPQKMPRHSPTKLGTASLGGTIGSGGGAGSGVGGGALLPLGTGSLTSGTVGTTASAPPTSLLRHSTSTTDVVQPLSGTGTKAVPAGKGQRGRSSSTTDITAEEVGSAMAFDAAHSQQAHLSVPGVMMRKALSNTVKGEVAEQLNKLINGQYRSRQLVKAIKDVYGPLSDPSHPPSKQQQQQGGNKTQLAPLQPPSASTKRKKRRVGLKGEILRDVGRIEATHSDFMTLAASSTTGTTVSNPTVEPGTSLLIDVPQGINDTIERLMHAAALRCYVPDFFQGVTAAEPSAISDADALLDSLSDENLDETAVEKLLLQRRQAQNQNPNANAEYAYATYLAMPFGLAKMRYEVQCKKFAQGPINRLRLKGLSFLADVHPVSKFVMCMRSVDTPRVLMNKCVDLYLELRAMGKVAPLGGIDRSSVDKFHRSVHTGQGQLPGLLKSADGTVAGEGQEGQLVMDRPSSPGGGGGGSGELQRSRSVQFAAAGSGSGDGQASLAGGRDSPTSLRKGEIGFDSIAEGENVPTIIEDLLNSGAGFPDTVEGRAAQRKFQKHQSELPGKMLLSMVENREELSWCDLHAPVEDIFLHAAFLVVPHVTYVPDLSAARMGSSSSKEWMEQRSFRAGSVKMKRVETPMGNAAFKQHTAEVLKIVDEDKRREMVKERFRAAFILTTPFTLYLKSKKVYTVDDLLRINLHDLGMPPALETQLEVLLTAVVSKCVDAKIVPIPRDHVSTAAELFTVPMFYDPKFQRSPLDPFGRPPRLQQRGSHKLVQKKLKATERRENTVNKAHHNLNKVASVQSIQEDLAQPVTLWTSSTAVRSEGTVHLQESIAEGELGESDSDGDGGGAAGGQAHLRGESLLGASTLSLGANLLDDSVMDGKWSFHAENPDFPSDVPSSRPGTHQSSRGGTGTPKARSRSSKRTDTETEAAARKVHISATEKVAAMVENDEIPAPTDANVWRKSLRSYTESTADKSPPKPRKDTKQFSQDPDFMTRNIEDKVFKYSFVCTHPHCGQVFARQYTYNIHLKSHELFGQYHDYKRQPQLFLDKDRSQIAATKQKQFEERITLPPVVQAELQKMSISR